MQSRFGHGVARAGIHRRPQCPWRPPEFLSRPLCSDRRQRRTGPTPALARYRQLVATPPDSEPPRSRVVRPAPAWRRLVELYEERGQRAEVINAYGRFAALWKDAHPQLHPVVREVCQRLAALAGAH